MRCQRFKAFRRLTSLICFLRDATAALFNPPKRPISRIKSGLSLNAITRLRAALESIRSNGTSRLRIRSSASRSSYATNLIPAAPKSAVSGRPCRAIPPMHQIEPAESRGDRRSIGKCRAAPPSSFPRHVRKSRGQRSAAIRNLQIVATSVAKPQFQSKMG